MKEAKVILVCAAMCVLTGLAVYTVITSQQKKIAVVDAIKLVNDFSMKQEMERIAKVKLQGLSHQLDSIQNVLRMANGLGKGEAEIKQLSYAYDYLKAKLENEYAQSNQDINTAVWKRLNPLIDAYGKEKDLHLIIGANGMGSVLFTDQYYDITDEVNKYVNRKYAEGN
jgi:outer membrane protein